MTDIMTWMCASCRRTSGDAAPFTLEGDARTRVHFCNKEHEAKWLRDAVDTWVLRGGRF